MIPGSTDVRDTALSAHELRVLGATCVASLGSFYTMAVTGFALPQIQRGLAIPENELGSLFALLRLGTLFSLALAVRRNDRRGSSSRPWRAADSATSPPRSRRVVPCSPGCRWARCFLGGQTLLASVGERRAGAHHRGWGLGLLSAVGGLGGALALLVFAFVDRLPYGWRALFVVGGFGLLCLPWLWRSLSETHRFAHDVDDGTIDLSGPAWQPLRDLVREHGWRVAAMLGVVAPVALLLEPGSVLVSKHLQDDLGYSPAGVSLLMGVCGVATPLGNLLSGTASDRFGRKPVTIGMSLVLSVAIALFYGDTGPVA